MDKVGGLDRMVGLLRSQIARRTAKASRSADGPSGDDDPGAEGASSASGMEQLRTQIVERLRRLPAGEERRARAPRVFVESVLVWEFGEDLLDDPETARLVERLDAMLAGDAALRDQMQKMIADLTGEASR